MPPGTATRGSRSTGRTDSIRARSGRYAAALVVYGRLFKAPLFDASLRRGIKPKTGRLLQAAATKALRRPVPAALRCGGK